jgi:predicted hotdog family 3-hydroxylacyl-ACP dehydratase
VTSFPPVAEVVPHKPPMLLLDQVLSYGDDRVTCEVRIGPDTPFLEEDMVPAVVGIEYMAQTVAAYAGLTARGQGKAARIGFLLGCRDLKITTDGFALGDRLVVEAHRTWGESDLGSFACKVERDGELLLQGVLTVYQGPLPEGMAPGTEPGR